MHDCFKKKVFCLHTQSKRFVLSADTSGLNLHIYYKGTTVHGLEFKRGAAVDNIQLNPAIGIVMEIGNSPYL